MKRLKSCQTCFESEKLLKHNILNNKPQFSSKNRDIHFAPCGNHHLFGMFNNGRTPKVVIMGVSTSKSAKKNFCENFAARLGRGLPFEEVLRLTCIANIFNSGHRTFHNNLSRILNLSGILKMISIQDPVEISSGLFHRYVNDDCSEDENKLVDSIYFSQAILCSSCKPEGKQSGPTRKDINDKNHVKCLNTQVEIVESFNSQVDLWVSLGTNDISTLSSQGCFEEAELQRRIRAKCKEYVRIYNIGGNVTAWHTVLDMNPNITREEFIAEVKERVHDKKQRFRKTAANCAEQLMNLRDAVKRLISS